MEKSVRIVFGDVLYGRMLSIVFAEKGYSVIPNGNEEIPDCTVTDIANFPDFASKKENLIVVDYGERDQKIPKNVTYFQRPVPETEITEAADTFTGDKPEEKKNVLLLDKKNKRAVYGKSSVVLTDTEFSLFSLLYEKKGALVTTEEINGKLWNGNEKKTNAPVVYVGFLRKKFEESFGQRMIVCVRNKGYILKNF